MDEIIFTLGLCVYGVSVTLRNMAVFEASESLVYNNNKAEFTWNIFYHCLHQENFRLFINISSCLPDCFSYAEQVNGMDQNTPISTVKKHIYAHRELLPLSLVQARVETV